MSLKASNQSVSKGSRQDPLEAGTYMARVVQVIDLGLQEQQPFQGKAKDPAHMISVTYELLTEFCKDEDGKDMEDKPRWISEKFPLYSLGSDLAKSTKRYRVLDPGLEYEGDWSKLVGAACQVTVNTYPKKDGSTGNGVSALTPMLKGVQAPELVNEPKVFDLSDPDMEVFEGLPEWLRGVITENLEYNGSVLQSILEGESKADDTDYSDVVV